MKTFRIVYNMYPAKDIEIRINAETEEDAIIYAKSYRKDSFRIFELQGVTK